MFSLSSEKVVVSVLLLGPDEYGENMPSDREGGKCSGKFGSALSSFEFKYGDDHRFDIFFTSRKGRTK